MEKLLTQLRSNEKIDDWRAVKREERSEQLYLIGDKTESERTVNQSSMPVSIYCDHEKDGKKFRGHTTITILPSQDSEEIAKSLEQAIFTANLVNNEPYGIPEKADYPETVTVDKAIYNADRTVVNDLHHTLVEAVTQEKDVKLASAEFFLNTVSINLVNSRGCIGDYLKTNLFFEMVLLASRGSEESENYVSIEVGSLADLQLEEQVSRYAQYARDSIVAKAPKTGRFPVVVSGKALLPLFRPFSMHCNAGAKYQGFARGVVGQSIFGDKQVQGEPLTIFSNGLIPFKGATGPFDGEGLPRQRLAVIENNVVANLLATQRFANYFGIQPTGEMATMEIPAGKTPMSELLADGRLYHIVAFSSMNPDPITGSFVGEIKLGYEVSDKGVRPIKGGSVSGNVFEAFANATYSQEVQDLYTYRGPEGVRFAELTVAGE